MAEDQQQALASLKHDQATLQGRINGLEDQRRLFEKLGHSRYYLDMQLEALKGELALCEFRLRLVEKGIQASSRAARQQARAEQHAQPEVTTRYLLPVIGAFIVSMLALGAAGLLWFQRFEEPVATPTATPVPVVVATVTPTATVSLPTPTPVRSVYAVVKTDGLNVRRDAGVDAPVLGIIGKGEVVQLDGDKEDDEGRRWYRILESGWVLGEHVQIFPTKEEAEQFAAEGLSE